MKKARFKGEPHRGCHPYRRTLGILTIVILLGFSLNVFSQNVTYTKSEELFKGYNGWNGYTNFINVVSVQGGYIGLVAGHTANFRNNNENDKNAVVTLFDENMNVKAQKELIDGEKKINVIGLIKSNGRIYYAYTIRDKKTVNLVISELNPSTLEKIKEDVNVLQYKFKDDSEYSQLQYAYSSDSSKVVFYYEHWNHKVIGAPPSASDHKEIQELNFVVLDKNLSKLYSRNYSFPYKGKEMKFRGFVAGNDGSLNILYYFFQYGDNTDETQKVDGRKVAPYEVRIKRLDETTDRDYYIQTNGIFIHHISFLQQPDNTFYVGGVYNDEFSKSAVGVFKARFTDSDKNVKVITHKYSDEILKTFDRRADFRIANLYNETISDVTYQTQKMIVADNKVYLFVQYLWSPNTYMGHDLPIHSSPVICSVIPETGNATTSMLGYEDQGFKIRQHYNNLINLNGQLYYIEGIILVSNADDIFSVINFDQDGKPKERTVVFKLKDQDGYSGGREYQIVNRNEVLFQMSNNRARKLYKLKFKE